MTITCDLDGYNQVSGQGRNVVAPGYGSGLLTVFPGGITSVTVNTPGTYTVVPTGITATGGGGSGFTGTVKTSATTVTGVTVTNPGKNYTSAPTIAFTGGTVVTSATATANVQPSMDSLVSVTTTKVDTSTQGAFIIPTGTNSGHMMYGSAGYWIPGTSGDGFTGADVSNFPSYVSWTTTPTGRFTTATGSVVHSIMRPIDPVQTFPQTSPSYRTCSVTAASVDAGALSISQPCLISMYFAQLSGASDPGTVSLYSISNTYPPNAAVHNLGYQTIGTWVQWMVNVVPGQAQNFYLSCTSSGAPLMMVCVDTLPSATLATNPIKVFDQPLYFNDYIQPTGVGNHNAGIYIDRGPGNTAQLLGIRFRNILSPAYSGTTQLQKNQLSRQSDAIQAAVTSNPSSWTTVAGPSAAYTAGNGCCIYPPARWEEIPVVGATAERYIGAFIPTCSTIGSANPLGAAISGLRFVGITPTLLAYDVPLCPSLNPPATSARSGTISVTFEMPSDNTGVTYIFYTTDSTLPVGDAAGTVYGTTTKVATGSSITISATTTLRAIAGFYNSAAYGGVGGWVYSRDISQGNYVIATNRVTVGAQWYDDGTYPLWNTFSYTYNMGSFPINMCDISVLDDSTHSGDLIAYGAIKQMQSTYIVQTQGEYTGVFGYKAVKSNPDFITWVALGSVLDDFTVANMQGMSRPDCWRRNPASGGPLSGMYYVMYCHVNNNCYNWYSASPYGPFTYWGEVQAATGDLSVFADTSTGVDGTYQLWLTYVPGTSSPNTSYIALTADGATTTGSAVVTGNWIGPGGTGTPDYPENREAPTGDYDPVSGLFFGWTAKAEYYNTSGASQSNLECMTASTVAGLSGATTALSPWASATGWTTANSYDYTTQVTSDGVFHSGTFASPSNIYQIIVATSGTISREYQTIADVPAYNFQSSKVFRFVGNNTPIILGDFWYTQGQNAFTIFTECFIMALPISISSGVPRLPLGASAAWDLLIYFTPPVAGTTTSTSLFLGPNFGLEFDVV